MTKIKTINNAILIVDKKIDGIKNKIAKHESVFATRSLESSKNNANKLKSNLRDLYEQRKVLVRMKIRETGSFKRQEFVGSVVSNQEAHTLRKLFGITKSKNRSKSCDTCYYYTDKKCGLHTLSVARDKTCAKHKKA